MPIFDQGYQHWNGALTGHAWRWLAITRHGVRAGLKNRLLRIVLFVAWSPALALAFIVSIWGLAEHKSATIQPYLNLLSFLDSRIIADPRHYRVEIWTFGYHYFLWLELRLSLVLILLVGPSLISQDLRFNSLPLYFSRPLRRMDYFLGKLGIIVAYMAMVVIIPSIVAYILGMAFSFDISILKDTFRILVSSVLYGLIIALSGGTLILALSALARNSRYVALTWIGVCLLSSITSGILVGVKEQQDQQKLYRQLEANMGFNVRPPPNETQDQRIRRYRAQAAVRNALFAEVRIEELKASAHDWRPLVSYTTDLSRLGNVLLGTDDTWRRLYAELYPEDTRGLFVSTYLGPQFPWYWSAYVLLGLFGLSACILKLSIKSLDRLK
ncbi:MAG: ABC transporter permease subunit [Tepidisphaeraceae bacterium]|jgi:ABC-2 type transport system permease protein